MKKGLRGCYLRFKAFFQRKVGTFQRYLNVLFWKIRLFKSPVHCTPLPFNLSHTSLTATDEGVMFVVAATA